MDAARVRYTVNGDESALTERFAKLLATDKQLAHLKLGAKSVAWTQQHDGIVAYMSLQPVRGTCEESFRVDFTNDGSPCFYLRESIVRNVYAFTDAERRALTPAAIRQSAVDLTARGQAIYQRLVEANPSIKLQTENALRNAFDSVDTDHSKQIDEKELALMLAKLNVRVPGVSTSEMLRLIDTGTLSVVVSVSFLFCFVSLLSLFQF